MKGIIIFAAICSMTGAVPEVPVPVEVPVEAPPEAMENVESETFQAKQLGDWVNMGECKATGTDSTCGPGLQTQKRTCTDGTADKCTDTDTEQILSCADTGTALGDCPKQLGDWTNTGGCNATGTDSTCGPGLQTQTRTCTDGTTDKCADVDIKQTILCADAGTALADCAKRLGEWTNNGGCKATGTDSTCGPGLQIQIRKCTPGTNDMCTDADTKQIILCEDAGTALPECVLPSSIKCYDCSPTTGLNKMPPCLTSATDYGTLMECTGVRPACAQGIGKYGGRAITLRKCQEESELLSGCQEEEYQFEYSGGIEGPRIQMTVCFCSDKDGCNGPPPSTEKPSLIWPLLAFFFFLKPPFLFFK